MAWRVCRRRAVLWRGASLGVLIVVAAFVAPGAADAHIRSGVIAVYRVTVSSLLPPFATAVKVQVSESDRALSLTARQGHLVVVLGYSGEAFLRLDSAGVAVNTASATAVSTGLLEGGGRAPGGEAAWRTQSDGPTIVWHDARLRRPPAGVEHRRWSVPLVIDGDRTALEGETRIVRPPSLWLWFGLGALFAAAIALLVVLGGAVTSRKAVGASAALAGAATIVTAAGFALDPTASTGRWVEGADEVLFAAVGIVVLARGSAQAQTGAVCGLGALALFVGLSKLEVFDRGVILSSLPANGARLFVLLALCAGTTALVFAALFLADAFAARQKAAQPRR